MSDVARKRMKERKKAGAQSPDDWNYLAAQGLVHWRRQVVLQVDPRSKIVGRLTRMNFDGETLCVRIRTDRTTICVEHRDVLDFSIVLDEEDNLNV